jgi:hypothetical protein
VTDQQTVMVAGVPVTVQAADGALTLPQHRPATGPTPGEPRSILWKEPNSP